MNRQNIGNFFIGFGTSMVLFSSLAMYISHKYHIHIYPKNTKKNLQDINEENNMFKEFEDESDKEDISCHIDKQL